MNAYTEHLWIHHHIRQVALVFRQYAKLYIRLLVTHLCTFSSMRQAMFYALKHHATH